MLSVEFFQSIIITRFTANTCEEAVVAKGPRVVITLECTEARKDGKTPSRYTTTKNKKTHPERLELKKYNPFLRKHTLHKEIK